jgi:hypothetical protein
MSDVDTLLTRDLAALGEDSRREPLPFKSLLRGGVYRDERPGVTARRDALLAARHQELALMPLALSRVFVHRVSRATAGGVAVACAALFVLADPLLSRFASRMSFGLDMLTGAALVVSAILAAYVAGGWIAERAFARRMRDSITIERDDVHADLDRLAEGPVAIGRKLVDRADGWALCLSLAGVLAVSTVFGVNVFVRVSFYGRRSSFEAFIARASMPGTAIALAVGVALCVMGAYAVTRVCKLEQRGGVIPRWARFESWRTAIVGLFLACATLYSGMHGMDDLQRTHAVPSFAWRLGHVALAVVSMFLLASFALLRRHRREMKQLERHDDNEEHQGNDARGDRWSGGHGRGHVDDRR